MTCAAGSGGVGVGVASGGGVVDVGDGGAQLDLQVLLQVVHQAGVTVLERIIPVLLVLVS